MLSFKSDKISAACFNVSSVGTRLRLISYIIPRAAKSGASVTVAYGNAPPQPSAICKSVSTA